MTLAQIVAVNLQWHHLSNHPKTEVAQPDEHPNEAGWSDRTHKKVNRLINVTDYCHCPVFQENGVIRVISFHAYWQSIVCVKFDDPIIARHCPVITRHYPIIARLSGGHGGTMIVHHCPICVHHCPLFQRYPDYCIVRFARPCPSWFGLAGITEQHKLLCAVFRICHCV